MVGLSGFGYSFHGLRNPLRNVGLSLRNRCTVAAKQMLLQVLAVSKSASEVIFFGRPAGLWIRDVVLQQDLFRRSTPETLNLQPKP